MLGQTVSHYKIEEELGGGAMGIVYKAQDLRLRRAVALKFLPPELTRDRAAKERFLREARSASALDHSNICNIHEIDQTADGQIFIAMAFYEGETVKSKNERGPLPVPEALDIAFQAADGLAAAHASGIVHRDIKPANLMMTERGEVKILDFGLAKLAGQSRLTRDGATVGTVAYMSPEQSRGESVDHRTDIWSWGVVLYEMLSGRLPFKGEYEQALIYSILNEDPEPLSQARPEVPPELETIVGRSLTKSPRSRYASADELVEALSALEGVERVRTVTRTRFRPWPAGRLGRWLWLGAGALLAAGLALGLYFALRPRPPAPAELFASLAILPFENFTGNASQDYFCEGISSFLISRLSEIPGLSVVSRSQAWDYRGSDKSPREIARELGVGLILEGGVQQAAERVQVDVNLSNALQGAVIWSDQFQGERDELFELQGKIAAQLAGVLAVPLSVRDRWRLARDPSRSLQAFDVYLRGVQLLGDVDDPRAAAEAAALFQKALEIDADFALAHAGYSEALLRSYGQSGQREALARAEAAAMQAVELDPELPEARVALARVFRQTGRYTEAIAELREILRRHPNHDAAYLWLTQAYIDKGELDAAEESARQALGLRPDYWRYWNELGSVLVKKGDYDGARHAFQQAAQVTPASEATWPYKNLGTLAMLEGNYQAAIDAYEQIPEQGRNALWASNIGTAYFYAGKLEEAESHFRLAVSLQPNDPRWRVNLADLYLRQGRQELARETYAEAVRLTELRLQDNPENQELLLRRSLFLAKAGRCGPATRQAGSLRTELPDSAEKDHVLALAYAVCGEREAALEALRSAIEQGFSPELIRQEDEFEPLHEDPEFRRLLSPS